jgi:hypothetical protein
MSAEETVVRVLLTLGVVAGVLALPKVWRGYFAQEVWFRGRRYTHGDAAFMLWGGPIARRGLARTYVPVLIGWCGVVVGLWVSAVNGGSAGQLAPVAAKVAALSAVAWFFFWLIPVITIILFNWPKFLVPPPQRSAKGALAERRSAGDIRRRTSRRDRGRTQPAATGRRGRGARPAGMAQ